MESLEAQFRRVCEDPDSDIAFHLPFFVALVDELDAEHVIELGVRAGHSTVAWLYALEGKGRLSSVDVIPHPGWSWPHWTYHQGSDLDVGPGLEEADIVFIDTSHLYAHTRAELDLFLPKVRAGGRILCHDTMLEHPHGDEGGPPFPVLRAVTEFCAHHSLKWREVRECWGLAIIEVP